MTKTTTLNRRCFLGSGAATVLTVATGGILGSSYRSTQSDAKPEKKVLVGAHPWVYAATQPNYDVYPVLDQILSLIHI